MAVIKHYEQIEQGRLQCESPDERPTDYEPLEIQGV